MTAACLLERLCAEYKEHVIKLEKAHKEDVLHWSVGEATRLGQQASLSTQRCLAPNSDS